jgi:UDP-galactopyranose mutase
MYDYLVVGSGFFGSVFAREAYNLGKKVLVIDKRNHIGGNCYSKIYNGINVHEYGPHIFNTKNIKKRRNLFYYFVRAIIISTH